MPVFTLMVCDLLDWLACPSATESSRRESVSGGKAPPSRFRASWILVSFVSRASAAHRWLGFSKPIFEKTEVAKLTCIQMNFGDLLKYDC